MCVLMHVCVCVCVALGAEANSCSSSQRSGCLRSWRRSNPAIHHPNCAPLDAALEYRSSSRCVSAAFLVTLISLWICCRAFGLRVNVDADLSHRTSRFRLFGVEEKCCSYCLQASSAVWGSSVLLETKSGPAVSFLRHLNDSGSSFSPDYGQRIQH